MTTLLNPMHYCLGGGGHCKPRNWNQEQAGQSAEVVILDTLNRATPGTDENDSKSMG